MPESWPSQVRPARSRLARGYTLDYESPADKNRDNTYNIEIVAADAYAGTDKLTVTFSVNNVDEPGTLVLSTTTPSVGTEMTASLSDPDGKRDQPSLAVAEGGRRRHPRLGSISAEQTRTATRWPPPTPASS